MLENPAIRDGRLRARRPPVAAILAVCLAAGVTAGQVRVKSAGGQQAAPSPPTFRSAANYVRVDLYATANGAAIDDLKPDELELRENGVAQKIDAFEYVRVRAAAAANAARAEPNTVAESRQVAAEARARVFVIFLDTYHTQFDGAVNIRTPLVKFLDRVLGPDDLVAVMTPDMSARGLTFGRKTTVMANMVQNDLHWATRGDAQSDRKEALYNSCYPPVVRAGRPDDTAAEMKRRRREKLTLDSVADLVSVLGTLREERKAVVMISEGWLEYRPNETLAALRTESAGKTILPPPQVFGLDPRPTGEPERPNASMLAECEGDRVALALQDDRERVQELTETANRANVTFYSLYPRGLAAFDAPMGADRPPGVLEDMANLGTRHQSLRRLAENTDGFAVIETQQFDPAIDRIIADLSSYYLLGYYSTDTRLDGKFRSISVKINRPGVQVRARRGYRALKSDDPRTTVAGGTASASALSTRRSLSGVVVDDKSALRVRASSWVERGDQGPMARLWVVGELDYRTRRDPEWASGATGEVAIVARDGTAVASQTIRLAAGEGVFSIRMDAVRGLASSEYSARVQLRPAASRLSPLAGTAPLQVSEGSAGEAILFRRGPSTGTAYVATADPRFTRTERIRVELPFRASDVPTARVLDRAGNTLSNPVQVTDRAEPGTDWRWIVAEVVLAPLAIGDYAVEVTGAGSQRVTEFRIVP